MEITLEAIISFIGLFVGGGAGAFFTWRYQRKKAKAEAEQAETDVIYSELEKQVLSIRTTVNHQEGLLDILGTRTDGIEADLIHFQVDGAASEVRVTNQDSESPTSYTSFKGDGMRIYVEGEQVAEATARRFECDKGLGVQDWAIEQGASANTLIFYRKG
jgi:hypothetical protein